MKSRLAIIGVGKWGSKIVRTVSASDSMDLVAAVTSKSFGELQEIAPFSGRVFRDYKDLGQHVKELDGVIIASPPAGRERIIDYFLDSSVPVFAEKPLTLDRGQTERLVNKARRLGVPLVEDFIHLYSWPYITITRELQRGSQLEIQSRAGNAGPYRDYSPVYDYGPHDISMALQLFKCMPRSIKAEIFDHVSTWAFSVLVKLDFGHLGEATLTFGNTFETKERLFSCRSGDVSWIYDDTAPEKLLRNGLPILPDHSIQNSTPLELALMCFAGEKSLYSSDEQLWLSKSVAELNDLISTRIGCAVN